MEIMTLIVGSGSGFSGDSVSLAQVPCGMPWLSSHKGVVVVLIVDKKDTSSSSRWSEWSVYIALVALLSQTELKWFSLPHL